MDPVEIAFFLVALTVVVLAGTAVAGRSGVPAPLLLIAIGVAGSFLPGVPEVVLEPEVVLFGLLPPLLYAAALQTSLVDFTAHRRPILLLSVGLVIFTTLGVGVVVHALLPDLGWPAAFAIGAVVAPPDAVAATAIARRIGLPRRLVTILEGESLLNDATALVALRTAIASAAAGVSAAHIAGDFLVAAGGGVVVGFLLFLVVAWVRKRVTDPLLDVGISLVVPIAAYVAAEKVQVGDAHGSGVIAVVVAGLLLGHKAPVLQTARSRIAERTNWKTIAFILENAVFLLIGLQARWILEDVGESALSGGRIVAVCVATLAAVVVLRLAWVFPVRYLLVRPGADPVTGRTPPPSYTFVLGWAGMRGVVTLAAAFVIPESTSNREVLLLVAFTVVAATLLLQGSSLPWVARRLGVLAADPAEDALARAALLHQASEAGLEVLERESGEDPHAVTDAIRRRIEHRNFSAWEQLGDPEDEIETPAETYTRLRMLMLEAERAKVLEVRDEGSVPQVVVAEVLAMLDVEESMLDVAPDSTSGRVGAARRHGQRVGPACEHLATDEPAHEPETPGECGDCVREGTSWVHLRLCVECGNVGCCDSSPQRHASAHFHRSGHPVVESAERGEDWRWCYVHHVTG
ncbi:MAG: cation:proton antiporter [Nocardioides sp.]